MKVSDLTLSQVTTSLRQGDLTLAVPPFVARVRSPIESVARGIALLYRDFKLHAPTEFADFHVALAPPPGMRRWLRPQVVFHLDGFAPFKPLPLDQAFPMFEWGLNWCIASHAHQFLVVHAAVVEMGGRALVLPAPPGSGKSTLCAGLVSRGWRLLSDELGLLDLHSGLFRPLARPLNLKNDSIDVIRRFQPDAVLTPPVCDTTKGTVAHLRPPSASVSRAQEPATPAWIVFPKFVAGATGTLRTLDKAPTLMRLIEQAFNYDILGARGFEAASGLVDRCECLEFSYGNLDEAVEIFAALARGSNAR